MKEQSHKEEMSAALRGDFQRLRDRGVPVTLVPGASPGPEPRSEEATADAETAAAVVPQAPVAPASAEARPVVDAPPEGDAGDTAAAGPTDVSPPPDEPRGEGRSWLARLVGR